MVVGGGSSSGLRTSYTVVICHLGVAASCRTAVCVGEECMRIGTRRETEPSVEVMYRQETKMENSIGGAFDRALASCDDGEIARALVVVSYSLESSRNMA